MEQQKGEGSKQRRQKTVALKTRTPRGTDARHPRILRVVS